MITTRIAKTTAYILSISLLLGTPVYAATSQTSGQPVVQPQPAPQSDGQQAVQQQPIQQSDGQKAVQQQPIQQSAGQQAPAQQTVNPQNQNIPNQEQLSNAAQFMVNQGILKGDSSGQYQLTNQVKRGDMALMLVRAFDLNSEAAGSENFKDVPQDSYYYDAIRTIKNLEIAQGSGDAFQPDSDMTLQEAILFVERALELSGNSITTEDLTSLFEGRSLSEYATREDVAAILYAALQSETEESSETEADVITYETAEDTPVTFEEEDFNEVCEDATEETLSYIKFSLPSSSGGRLYYGYESSDSPGEKVTSSDKYYYDEDPSISDVTFLPATGYTGTVKIDYTGRNEDGNTFQGVIQITVD